MVYVLPPMGGSWSYSAVCEGCGAVTQVTARSGRGISPDACGRCGGRDLAPVDDRKGEED